MQHKEISALDPGPGQYFVPNPCVPSPTGDICQSYVLLRNDWQEHTLALRIKAAVGKLRGRNAGGYDDQVWPAIQALRSIPA